jgi:hypothetical protein
MIASWPGSVTAGRTDDALIDFSDFLPTLAELSGSGIPQNLTIDGRSFVPQLRQTSGPQRKWIYNEFQGLATLQNETFKMYSDGRLYDLVLDPDEQAPIGPESETEPSGKIRTFFQLTFDSLYTGTAGDIQGEPWQPHTIDNNTNHAGGGGLSDVHGDGLQDITSVWKESSEKRISLSSEKTTVIQDRPEVNTDSVVLGDAVFADLDGDGMQDSLTTGKQNGNSSVLVFRRTGKNTKYTILLPANTGTVKRIAVGDIDADNRLDIVVACEAADRDKQRIFWLKAKHSQAYLEWNSFDISGTSGIKNEDIRLVDLDDDGDLDVLVGVSWYENPKSFIPKHE